MIDSDPSNPDGLLFIVDDEYKLEAKLSEYDLRDLKDSFIVSGVSDVTGEKVTIVKKYGKFEKEAGEYMSRFPKG